MEKLNDNELLELFAQQEQKTRAFELIIDKYSQRIYWVIRKMVISHYDTDDILQEVLLKLWTELHKFRAEASIFTWLYRIAINQAISFLRSKKRSQNLFVSKPVEEFLELTSQENLFDGDKLEAELQKAILTLPNKQKAVFILRYYDQMPFKEMSEVLETSEGALKTSYHIAREKVETLIKLSLD